MLDGLAEMLLRFNTSEQQFWFDIGRNAHDLSSRARAEGIALDLQVYDLTFPISRTRDDLADNSLIHLSGRQRRKLYEFDPNVDVSVFFGTLMPAEGAALKSLHHYRNRAYHHNDANAGALGGLVQVQLAVVAKLARAIRPLIGVPIASSRPLPPDFPDVATALNADTVVDTTDLIESLRQAVREQIRFLDARVAEIAAFVNSVIDLVDADDVLRLVQLPEPWPDLVEVRTAQVDVSPERVAEWRVALEQIGASGDALIAVSDYFAIEKPLARLLEDVEAVADQADRAIDRALDERRGR